MNEQGTVGVPNEYFLKMAKHDYEDYHKALPREFYQNSIDAGATEIRVDSDTDERCIIVHDNGSGMTKDILLNKLLVLGGSHKAEGAVGAFGKAKELLFFSWDKYTIRTGNLVVEGKGAEYVIRESTISTKGTTCCIWLPSGESVNTILCWFRYIASYMQCKTKILVDGVEIECGRKRGKAVKVVDGVGVIHQVKSRNSLSMPVRINGIWMFDMYVGSDMGELIIELSESSIDLLTSNRDGFKWDARNKISRLIEELTTNKKAALRRVRTETRVNIKGTGKITVGEKQLAIAKLKVENGSNLRAVIDKVFDAGVAKLTAIQQRRINSAAQIIDVEWDEFKKHIEFIGYEPDFTLLHETGKDETVEKFMTTKKARLLATMWTEMIKQVLMDNQKYLTFNVGFNFDPEIEASMQQNDSETIFYLNPNSIKISEHRQVVIEDLKDLAIHEIAHLHTPNHTADFVNEMAEVRKRVTRADQKAYSDIQRTRA